MRKFLSVILLIAILISTCSCVMGGTNGTDPNSGTTPPGDSPLTQPEYKDYGRGTIDFDKIEYLRPDVDGIITAYSDTVAAVNANNETKEDLLARITAAEDLAFSFLTTSNYVEIMTMMDNSDEYWNTEYTFLTGKRADISKAAEDLCIACARSVHAEYFEDEYFGDGLIEKYKDGGTLTDALVTLMKRETELENEYSLLNGGPDARRAADILVDLIKVRKEISDELGHESYLTYAYENIYHDYSPEEAIAYILDISKYVIPVYAELSKGVFSKHFNDEGFETISSVTVINDTFEILKNENEELADIYAYMLQHKLFDISPESATRFQGSFCTYMHDYAAPYVFVTATESYRDYSTVAHEFGHFADAYLNYGESASLDQAEISSQGLEYIMLTFMRQTLTDSEYKALFYAEIEAALSTLIFQGFYALFEHYAYELDYDKINEYDLINCMRKAAWDMGLNYEYFTSLDQIIIPHIMMYPTYVQSYCTSMSVSLELFTVELKTPGEGLEIYMDLINRDEGDMAFAEYLTECGLTSPFEKDYLKNIADEIYYRIVGSHYYKDIKTQKAA